MSGIGREAIMTMIPHNGAMCLLDEVLDWDMNSVHCSSHRFCNPDNPMRRDNGVLGVACGIEIAAQAMAVHARLTAPQDGLPAPGYLVSLREVRLSVARLDAGMAPLSIHATRQMLNHGSASYSFRVTGQGAELVSGRAVVLMSANQ